MYLSDVIFTQCKQLQALSSSVGPGTLALFDHQMFVV